MGYSIYIGNAVVETDEDELEAWYGIEHIELKEAPFWPNPVDGNGKPKRFGGDASGKTNGRHPSYTSMSDWARAVGLENIFYKRGDGLFDPHPGIKRLTPEIHAEVLAAKERWERDHPNARPGWREGDDAVLAKLIWYEWWIGWALKNCERPAISNS
jgi:hypothetical protein